MSEIAYPELQLALWEQEKKGSKTSIPPAELIAVSKVLFKSWMSQDRKGLIILFPCDPASAFKKEPQGC